MNMGKGIVNMGKSQGGMRQVQQGIASMAKAVDASWWNIISFTGAWESIADSKASSLLDRTGNEKNLSEIGTISGWSNGQWQFDGSNGVALNTEILPDENTGIIVDCICTATIPISSYVCSMGGIVGTGDNNALVIFSRFYNNTITIFRFGNITLYDNASAIRQIIILTKNGVWINGEKLGIFEDYVYATPEVNPSIVIGAARDGLGLRSPFIGNIYRAGIANADLLENNAAAITVAMAAL